MTDEKIRKLDGFLEKACRARELMRELDIQKNKRGAGKETGGWCCLGEAKRPQNGPLPSQAVWEGRRDFPHAC